MTDNIIKALANISTSSNNTQSSSTVGSGTSIKLGMEFCAEAKISSKKVSLNIAGIGDIAMPLKQKQIKEMLKISNEAKFGLREQTLLDKTIRNTQEIHADQLDVQYDEEVLEQMLLKIRDSLNLPKHSRLIPHLHNLLIYREGQFFKPHQDSEKVPRMIATMVVVLPSAHIGGALLVHHGKLSREFTSENLAEKNIKVAAFYADCPHEVLEVTKGYRVALTYNLSLSSDQETEIDTKQEPNFIQNLELNSSIKSYFSIPKDQQENDHMLVYLLDHAYTEHSLRWDLLKGKDHMIAHALLGAANTLNLVPHLALAEIYQAWEVEEEYDYDNYKSNNSDGSDISDLKPIEMIDEQLTLEYWVDDTNKVANYAKCDVNEEQVCSSIDSDKDHLINYEYEGWMGNYGSTLDYWYRRAAIVLWEHSTEISMQFNLNYAESLAKLLALTSQKGHASAVTNVLDQADDYLFSCDKSDEQHLKWFMQIAVYIEDEVRAQSLLDHFSIRGLDASCACELLLLEKSYSIEFMDKIINSLIKNDTPHSSYFTNDCEDKMLCDSAAFVRAALKSGLAKSIVRNILDYHINTFIENGIKSSNIMSLLNKSNFKHRSNEFTALIWSCHALGDLDLATKVIAHTVEHPNVYQASDLVALVLELQKETDNDLSIAYSALYAHVKEMITQEFKQGLRSKKDYSIFIPSSDKQKFSKCKLSQIAMEFAQSPTEIQKVWGIAKDDRQLVESCITRLGIAVCCEVIKQGSPHKLVMTKSDNIYKESKQRFDLISTYNQLFQ
ncbi:hypothetical protein AwWohl_13110 [Gammaproteobacteria bacterium]|nr:hypothetical protein AwWohl_13110 [Gammaproteobacteria bacterium]